MADLAIGADFVPDAAPIGSDFVPDAPTAALQTPESQADYQSRTGQLYPEPSTVTAGTEPDPANANLYAAGKEIVGGMIPHDIPSYLAQIYPPASAFHVGQDLAQGNVGDIPFVGRVPEIMQADQTPAFSKERYATAVRTMMDLGLLTGAGHTEAAPVEDIRQSLAPEAPVNAPESPVSRPEPEAVSPLQPPTVDAQAQRHQFQEPTDEELDKANQELQDKGETAPDIPERPLSTTEQRNAAAEGFKPALRLDNGEVIGGENHGNLQDVYGNGQRGYVDSDGNFYNLMDTVREINSRASDSTPKVREALSLDELRLMRERSDLQLQNELSKRATGNTHPAIDDRISQINDELDNIANRELAAKPDVPEGTFDTLRKPAPVDTAAETPNVPEPAASASVPVMITRQMEADLKSRGYTQEEINAMKPQEANDVLNPQNEPRPTDQTVEQPAGQQAAVPEQPAGVGGRGESAAGAEGGQTAREEPSTGISTKNAYTDSQRVERGFPEAVQEARRDFGTVWDEAEETNRRDPGAGARLVESINDGKTKAVSDADNALLLREQIGAQSEHTAAVDAVNAAATDADRTAATARLTVARDRLQNVYEADRKAGRATGQGLNARKMLENEDYSLAKMEARKRAANKGEPLNDAQLKHTDALHAQIDELSKKIDQLQQSRPRESFGKVAREAKGEARSASASGKKFTDFMDEQAQKARDRLIAKRGRLNAGIDPTNLVDEAIIGASHIAKGLTKFADWSAQMVKDFGEKINPYLKDIWVRAKAIHNAANKAYRTPDERAEAASKTRMAGDMIGLKAKIDRGDFTKPTREQRVLSTSEYKMKANLQKLKNEFERGVAKDAYKNMSPADKFWQHFVGIERSMKLSSPAVFEKLGMAAAVREAMSPLESAHGYVVSKVFPKLAKGTRYGADLSTLGKAEWDAKASIFTDGIKDAWENAKGKETELEAMSDKYGRQPDFWYNRIGKFHAMIKAPIKRAEFTRSLALKMDAATKAGEDVNHPAVMERLATESALEADRSVFQQKTAVSKVFSMLDKASPAAGRTARFLAPVVKIPVNLFKELVTYHTGSAVGATKIGMAYWKGIETLDAPYKEAIIRQFTKGNIGGAALIFGYANRDKVRDFFKSMPSWFEHTPIAMAIHEGSLIGDLQAQGTGTKFRPTQAWKDTSYFAKTSIPFAYTVTGMTDALDASDPHGWQKYLYGMIEGSTVPQAASWTAKEMDKPTPFNPMDKPAYRPPQGPWQAIEQGIPGLRQNVPIKSYKH